VTLKKIWWILGASAAAIAVGGGTTLAVINATGPGDLVHDPAMAAVEPQQLVQPVGTSTSVDTSTSAVAPSTNNELRTTLETLSQDPRLGQFGGQVTDATTGSIVWEKHPTKPMTPASTTKILTAAAALLVLGPDDRIDTAVVEGDAPGTVVLRGAGDVMLTTEKLDDLAKQIKHSHPAPINTVLVDTSHWSGESFLSDWDRADIAGGFIAPMEPVMLYGARIGETTGDVPRSETPALDVARQLATRLGAEKSGLGQAPTTEEAPLALVHSDTLEERLRELMQQSDNVSAEAVGREIALHEGMTGTNKDAVAATLQILNSNGFSTSGVTLVDNSGMSTKNLIPPGLLNDIMHRAVTDPQLRPLLETLPVAGASGTLEERYRDQAGAGWVRGKTGTLTKTTGLAGTVMGADGHIYSYGFLSNDADVQGSRAAMDTMTSAIRD